MANGYYVNRSACCFDCVQEISPTMKYGDALGSSLLGQPHGNTGTLAFRAASDEVINKMGHTRSYHCSSGSITRHSSSAASRIPASFQWVSSRQYKRVPWAVTVRNLGSKLTDATPLLISPP